MIVKYKKHTIMTKFVVLKFYLFISQNIIIQKGKEINYCDFDSYCIAVHRTNQ